MKKFIIGVLIGCMLMASPVLADSLLTKIDVILNGVNVQLEGEDVEVNSILYNGSTYLPIRKVAELVGKDIDWNQETMTANIVNKKEVSEELPYIVRQEFVNEGTTTMYAVAFSDGFGIAIGTPKETVNEINPLFEAVFLLINVKNMSSTEIVTTPNIVGFNDYFGFKYYPVGFNNYKNDLPDNVQDGFKKLDFYENFKLYKNGDSSIKGLVYYESFPFLEAITYDDGVHKCTLYLEDKGI